MKITNKLIVSVLAFSIYGCDQSQQLPVGTTLSVLPTSVNWQIESGSVCSEDGPFQQQTVLLSLRDNDGFPLGPVDVELSLDLSGNTFTGFEVLALFYDSDSNGIFSSDEKVSVDGGPIFVTETDRLNGAATVMVEVNLSCSYRGNLYAYAGGVGATSEFFVSTVSETDESAENQ